MFRYQLVIVTANVAAPERWQAQRESDGVGQDWGNLLEAVGESGGEMVALVPTPDAYGKPGTLLAVLRFRADHDS